MTGAKGRRAWTAVAAAIGLASASGCDQILQIPSPTASPHLTCVDGACTCEAPYTYCTAKLEGTCDIDLQTDGKNCGRCGHDCLGGACEAGACQPVVLNTTIQPVGLSLYDGLLYLGICYGGTSQTAFETLTTSGAMAGTTIMSTQCGSVQDIFDDTLYWGGQTAIESTSLNPIAPSPSMLATTNAWVLAPNTEYLYWGAVDANGNDLGVYGMTLPSGPPQHLTSTPTQGVAANSRGAYWITVNDGIHFWANGATSDTLLSATPGGGLVVDEEHIFYSNDAGLKVIPVDGGTPLSLAETASLGYGVIDGDQFFWVDPETSTVNQVPIAGGKTTVLGRNYAFCNTAGLAVDAQAVYWLAGPLVVKVAR